MKVEGKGGRGNGAGGAPDAARAKPKKAARGGAGGRAQHTSGDGSALSAPQTAVGRGVAGGGETRSPGGGGADTRSPGGGAGGGQRAHKLGKVVEETKGEVARGALDPVGLL